MIFKEWACYYSLPSGIFFKEFDLHFGCIVLVRPFVISQDWGQLLQNLNTLDSFHEFISCPFLCLKGEIIFDNSVTLLIFPISLRLFLCIIHYTYTPK